MRSFISKRTGESQARKQKQQEASVSEDGVPVVFKGDESLVQLHVETAELLRLVKTAPNRTKKRVQGTNTGVKEGNTRRTVEVLDDEDEEQASMTLKRDQEHERAGNLVNPIDPLSFHAEEARVRQAKDTFYPDTRPSKYSVEWQKSTLKKELDRQDELQNNERRESEQQLQKKQVKRSQLIKNRLDASATLIQAQFRGFQCRRKWEKQLSVAVVVQSNNEVESNTDQWHEVHDAEHNEVWYYNATTGTSEWELPIGQTFVSAISVSNSLPVLHKKNITNNRLRANQQRSGLDSKDFDTLPTLSPSCSSARSTFSDQEQQYQISGTYRSNSGKKRIESPRNLPALRPECILSSSNAWECDSVLSSERSLLSASIQDETRESENDQEEPLFSRRRAHSLHFNEARDDEGDDTNSDWQTNDTFFRADGSKNSRLRDTIRKALHVSKFDSISSLLASNVVLRRKAPLTKDSRHQNASPGSRREIVLGKREQPVFVAVLARTEGDQLHAETTKRYQKFRKKASRAPQIRDLADPGFYDQPVHHSRGRHHTSQQDADASSSKARQEAVRVCFNCWSASNGQFCDLHHDPNETIRKVRSSESALMCRNWELDQLRRKYRAEEIQEIFMKQRSCLRYDGKLKQYRTVTECQHPIYRAIEQLAANWNKTMRRKLHTRSWLRSFIEQIRLGHVPKALQSSQDRNQSNSLVILKATLQNARWVSKYSESVNEVHPKASVTEKDCSGTHLVPIRDVLMIDPARPEIHNWIFVTEYTTPVALYQPRVYEVPPPRCVPMPVPSFAERVPLPAPNVHIDAGHSASWFERVSARLAIAAERKALIQIKACSPSPGSMIARRTKHVKPLVVLFATFLRKSTRGNRDVGGLSAQLVIHMLVTTYIPAQFGNFIVFDRRAVAPLPSSDETASFACLSVTLSTPVPVVRALKHALNHRRPPCIVVANHESGSIPRHFPLNRPEQTGEEEANGFRTFYLVDALPVSEFVPRVHVVPSGAILAPNVASMNATCTTRVDRTYPFCVPTTRENTPVDFIHLLWIGRSSRNQPQTFTAMGQQQPGDFMRNSNPNGVLGPCTTVVYRCWAYMQDNPFDEFVTEDGVAYWYDRNSGDTFWTRPILPIEKYRGKDGDIDGVVATGEGEMATLGIGLGPQNSAPYSQENLRKYITKKIEAPDDQLRRVKLVSASAKKHEIVVDMTPNKASLTVKKGELQRMQVPQLSLKRSTGQARFETPFTKSRVQLPGDCTNVINTVEETAMPSLDDNTKQMIDSITQALGSAFPALNQGSGATNGANVDMLQLGIGLGMGLGMRAHQQSTSLVQSSVVPRQLTLTADDMVETDDQIEISERSETISEMSSRSECSVASVDITPTPDCVGVGEGPHVGKKTPGYVTHAFSGEKISRVRMPIDELEENQIADNGTEYQRVACLPRDFVAAVSRTTTCQMHANYLPIIKNTNQPKSVGNVRPRGALDEWLAIGYSPWSAGRSVFGTQFIDDLVLRPELVNAPDTIAPVMTKVSVRQVEQRDVVSQAVKEKEQLDNLFSLCRHGKYDEIELLLNSPDWSHGIDVRDVTGNTLLSVACQNNNKRIAKLCLRRGADINTQNLNGQSLLHYCHEYGFHDLMEYLLDKGARDDLLNTDGLTCYEGLSQEAVDAI